MHRRIFSIRYTYMLLKAKEEITVKKKRMKRILSLLTVIAVFFGMLPTMGELAFAADNEAKVLKGSVEVQEISGDKDAAIDSDYKIEIELKDGKTFEAASSSIVYPNNSDTNSPGASWVLNAPCDGTESDGIKETVAIDAGNKKATITLSGNFKKNAYEKIKVTIPNRYLVSTSEDLEIPVNQYWAVGKGVVITEMNKPVVTAKDVALPTGSGEIKAKIKLVNLNFDNSVSAGDVSDWVKDNNGARFGASFGNTVEIENIDSQIKTVQI